MQASKRADFIRNFVLPQGLFDKLRATHPHLSLKDCQPVPQALQQLKHFQIASGSTSTAQRINP